ncbi:hypothetical protein LTR94_034613, partial [Friedmanniomyces endolithicus]
ETRFSRPDRPGRRSGEPAQPPDRTGPDRKAGGARGVQQRPVGRGHPEQPSGPGDRGLRISAGPRLGHRPEGKRQRRPADRRAERAQGADRGRLWAGRRADRRLFLAHHPQRHPARLP